MFERFTAQARASVVLATELAATWQDDHIGSEHLLTGAAQAADGAGARALAQLGVLPEAVVAAARSLAPPGIDGEALARLGIDLDAVRTSVETTFGAGALERAGRAGRRHRGHIPFDPHAKKMLEVALREAVAAGHRHIDTGHLMLAAARLDQTGAHRVLLALHVGPDELRDAVRRVWAAEPGESDDPGDATALVG